MFLSGPIWQVWILKGNYSSSMLLDTVPLTDPLMTAESLATGYLPEITTIIGALIIVIFLNRTYRFRPLVPEVSVSAQNLVQALEQQMADLSLGCTDMGRSC